MENSNRQEFSWSISADERKKSIKKMFAVSFVPLTLLAGVVPFFDRNSESALAEAVLLMSGVMVGLFVFYLLSRIFVTVDREYVLSEKTITFVENQKPTTFAWSEFICFYNYTDRMERSRRKSSAVDVLVSQGLSSEGDIFYLEKRKDFGKTFFVLRTVPNNSFEVEQFLLKKLPKKEMTNTTDLGIIRYRERYPFLKTSFLRYYHLANQLTWQRKDLRLRLKSKPRLSIS